MMFWIIEKIFIVLLGFGESLAAKCVPLNNELCMTMPILVDLNPVEINYNPFIIF